MSKNQVAEELTDEKRVFLEGASLAVCDALAMSWPDLHANTHEAACARRAMARAIHQFRFTNRMLGLFFEMSFSTFNESEMVRRTVRDFTYAKATRAMWLFIAQYAREKAEQQQPSVPQPQTSNVYR